MSDVTKDLLDALKGLMALPDHRVDLRDAAKPSPFKTTIKIERVTSTP